MNRRNYRKWEPRPKGCWKCAYFAKHCTCGLDNKKVESMTHYCDAWIIDPDVTVNGKPALQ